MGFLDGRLCENSSTPGGFLGNAAFDAAVLACVEGHADEKEEQHGDCTKLAVFVHIGGADEKEGECENGTTEEKQNHHVHVGHKQIRPNHTQCKGNDEANKRIILPIHGTRSLL